MDETAERARDGESASCVGHPSFRAELPPLISNGTTPISKNTISHVSRETLSTKINFLLLKKAN